MTFLIQFLSIYRQQTDIPLEGPEAEIVKITSTEASLKLTCFGAIFS